jgi:phosphoglycerol transferase MdoB-like AlkP superfamily enzyme
MEWGKIFYVIGAIILIAIVVWTIRSQPQQFTKEKIGKSFFSMGILALILIAFIALLVFLLRS